MAFRLSISSILQRNLQRTLVSSLSKDFVSTSTNRILLHNKEVSKINLCRKYSTKCEKENKLKIDEKKPKSEVGKLRSEEEKSTSEIEKIKCEENPKSEETPKSKEEKPKCEEEPKIAIGKIKCEAEKPRSNEEKPKCEVEKPKCEVEKPKCEVEKPKSKEEKPKRKESTKEDEVFNMYADKETKCISILKLLNTLQDSGLELDDPRLKDFVNKFDGTHLQELKLPRDAFKSIVSPNIDVISRACRKQFVIPEFSDLITALQELFCNCKANKSGEVANYIPQLAKVKPERWGVSVCTVDGQRVSFGNATDNFTIQSCSKPLVYAIALENIGPETMGKHVGKEPSGGPYNEIILNSENKPHNAMINSGALVTCSLVSSLVKPNLSPEELLDYTTCFIQRMAGGKNIGFNENVFKSEAMVADHIYSMGFYLRQFGCFPENAKLTEVMKYFFKCCSIETNCEIMSMVAATLANGGVCPLNGDKVLSPDTVRDVLCTMHSCGTYDYSGQFAFEVGLPAKSSTSGAMMLVVPNIMGICAWSPPLNAQGNSVRALEFYKKLVDKFSFHGFEGQSQPAKKTVVHKHKSDDKLLPLVKLLYSAADGDVETLRLHRLSGMDFEMADCDKRTALHLAAAGGHLKCVKFLLQECKVTHNPKDRWGNLPIHEAERFRHTGVYEYLKDWAKKTDQQS